MARTLTRWDPFAELASMRTAFDRVFDQAPRVNGAQNGGAATLGIDVYETPDELVVKAAVPGINPDDVEISVDDDVLTIKGEHRHEEETKDETWHRRELRFGSFHRALRLPPTVDAERATAGYENGMLKLTLPKKAEAKPRSIKITPAGVTETTAEAGN